jgi:uncharacterized coiled-coil DUF342 family protein
MDSLKKPEMALALFDLVAIGIVAVQFNRQTSEIQDELKQLSQHLKTTVTKGEENSTKITQLIDSIKNLDPIFNKMKADILGKIDDLQQRFEDQQEQIDDIVATLNENNMEIISSEKRYKAKTRARKQQQTTSVRSVAADKDEDAFTADTVIKARGQRVQRQLNT